MVLLMIDCDERIIRCYWRDEPADLILQGSIMLWARATTFWGE
jgi:hypothetical protein